jgi:ABC-type Fe3+-hydroxamate transport system substrate-binding protein
VATRPRPRHSCRTGIRSHGRMSVFRFRPCVITLLFVTGLAACDERPRLRSDVERDDFGVVLPATTAERIVSLSPATTEVLYTLGAGPRLVGRTKWDVFPPEVMRVPDVGDGIDPNVEAILAVEPDLVVLYASGSNRDEAEALGRAGVSVVSLRMDLVSEFYRAVRILGALTGTDDAARIIADTVAASLASVRQRTANLARPTVFLPSWITPLLTIGAGSYLTELVAIAGARNVYDDHRLPSPQISLEDVIRRDPDIVLAAPNRAALLRSDPSWRVLRAVRERRVLVFDTTLVGRPSVRMGEAAASLAKLFHPDVFR